MLQGNTLKMQPLKKTELITHPVEMRLSDAYEAYYGYLDDGYTITYGPASGNIDLTGLTPGKYLVVWQSTAPTGTLNVSAAKTLTGTTGAHEAVVIMGALIPSSKRITSIGFSLVIDMTPADDYDTLKFHFAYISFSGTAYAEVFNNLHFNHCKIAFTGNAVKYKILDLMHCDCVFNYGFGAPKIMFESSESKAHNCRFYSSGIYSLSVYFHVACNAGNFNNLWFENWLGDLEFLSATANPTINFNNLYIKTASLNMGTYPVTNNGSLVYLSNVSIVNPSNYRYAQFSGSPIWNDLGIYRLETDLIDWDAMETLSAEFVAEREIDRSLFYARASRMYYIARFSDTVMVPDSLKKFGEGYYFVVRREDYEADLIDRTITSGCVLSGSEFQSDENFLVLATDTLGNEAVFAWVDNQMLATVFSDVYDTRTYTITHCFQIWEQYSMSGLSNTIRKPSEAKAITDSPLSGEVKFNNLDNEVIA